MTTERSFSAELASTNSCVNDTVPVTAPPAWPTIFDDRVDIVVLGVRGAEDYHRLAVQRVVHHPACHLGIESIGRA